jgi:hypothetical protein
MDEILQIYADGYNAMLTMLNPPAGTVGDALIIYLRKHRNMIFGGSGTKALFWGTVGNNATMTSNDLVAKGFATDRASDIITSRDIVRNMILGMVD